MKSDKCSKCATKINMNYSFDGCQYVRLCETCYNEVIDEINEEDFIYQKGVKENEVKAENKYTTLLNAYNKLNNKMILVKDQDKLLSLYEELKGKYNDLLASHEELNLSLKFVKERLKEASHKLEMFENGKECYLNE